MFHSILDQAFDFHGHEFTVVAMRNQYFVEEIRGEYSGAELEIFDILGRKLGFSMRF